MNITLKTLLKSSGYDFEYLQNLSSEELELVFEKFAKSVTDAYYDIVCAPLTKAGCNDAAARQNRADEHKFLVNQSLFFEDTHKQKADYAAALAEAHIRAIPVLIQGIKENMKEPERSALLRAWDRARELPVRK
jgi:hypothetical protein